jgi:hypothetical protein
VSAVRRALVLILAPLLATLALTAADRQPGVAAATAPEAAALGAAAPAAEPVDFAGQVRPLLAERCFRCHGLDEQKGEVRLDTRTEVFRERDGWSVVVPGDLAASELWYRINAEDPEERMPPAEAGPPLTPEERALLGRWIEEGADWREHWALEAPRAVAPPAVRDVAWPREDLDRFILAELEERGLGPAPETDRATWLRRVSFILTGLPPAPTEVESFLADASPAAYERVVDRLLASPHYGEKWARHWLDLVRYAETRGHEFDFRIPNAFEYRDWVVRAYNADLPFDDFTREQIAGDLLDPPRRHPEGGWNESLIGTGFWWLGEEIHSPVDLRQDQADRTANKVDVFGKTFLGLTVACARCHDHKFDPILAQDYYGLAGIVQSSSYREARFESLERDAEVRAELESLRSAAFSELTIDFLKRAESGLRTAPRYRADAASARAELTAADAAETFASADEAAWASWTATGNAFGLPPTLREEHSGDGRGSLSSSTFTIARDEIRILVGGGNHPGKACVNLVIDGEIVLSETGRDARVLEERVWDVRAWRGRAARIEAVDELDGEWGWIAFDRIEFRDSIAGISEREAARSGLDAQRLLAWARQDERQPPVVMAPLSDNQRLLEDWADPRAALLLQDGSAWVLRAAGAAEFGSSAARPVTRIFELSCAAADPLWTGLQSAPGTEQDPSKLRWRPAGRMLRSRSFELASGRVWYLARGRGTVFANVAGHRMLEGPLHQQTAMEFDTGADWRWVGHDLTAYAGMAAHVEFTPRGGGGERPDEAPDLAIARVIEADQEPALPRLPNWDGQELAWAAAHPDLLGPLSDPASAPVEAFLAAQRRALERRILVSRSAPAMLEGSGMDERRYVRGNPADPAEPAPRRTLAALRSGESSASNDAVAGSGRLALAESTAAATNPLTARVAVNRAWHYVFGRGLAASTDNLGALGQPPTHPELLDWLAERFVSVHGWRLKPLLRELLLSSVFRQSSTPLPESQESDPANRYFHHVAVRRLEAEDLRDAVLAVSGRLDRKVGGPPVPVHLTAFMEGRGRPGESGPLDGNGRRSLYVEVRRNFLPPFLQAFDFPTPFTTIGRRSVSNVPAQALALMNDPFVLEQAESWTERLLSEPLSQEARIRRACLEAYGRPPAPDELSILTEFLDQGGNWGLLLHALLLAQEFQYVR